jgi:hypothetical protein
MECRVFPGLVGGLVLILGACSGSNDNSNFDNPKGQTPFGGNASSGDIGAGSSSGGASSGSSGTSGVTTPQQTSDCSEAAKLVYVVSEVGDLYSFKPASLTFTKIGRLACPGQSLFNSMAVDRKGYAWVNDIAGHIFHVSTADASCEATSYQPGQGGFNRMGMAFATNGADTTTERLYVDGLNDFLGKGLSWIDLASLKLSAIGPHSGDLAGVQAELTGTGDGRLYGFFNTLPATLAQIDRATGATSNEIQLTRGVGTAWAFSFWGGDFWFYTAEPATPSVVTRLKYATDQSQSVVMSNVGNFRIVGAGVSTCAPTSPIEIK